MRSARGRCSADAARLESRRRSRDRSRRACARGESWCRWPSTFFLHGDLVEPALVAPARVLRLQPELEDLVRETEGDDASADREDVGVVVLARQARGIQIVAERRADAGYLVGGDLFALTAAAEHDPAIGAPLDHRAADGETDRRV